MHRAREKRITWGTIRFIDTSTYIRSDLGQIILPNAILIEHALHENTARVLLLCLCIKPREDRLARLVHQPNAILIICMSTWYRTQRQLITCSYLPEKWIKCRTSTYIFDCALKPSDFATKLSIFSPRSNTLSMVLCRTIFVSSSLV